MKISWKKLIAISSLIVLSACSSHKRQDDAAINDANSAYGDGAQARGLGDGSAFGDEDGRGQGLARRIFYFDFDSNVVQEDDRPSIETHGRYLKSHPQARVTLEGHTDPRGSREYNIGLGERRARAVQEVLLSQGAAIRQIRLVSYGAEKLAVPGRSETDYQKDRRVVIIYTKK